MKKQLKHIVVNINDLKPAAYNPREELRPGDPEYENIKNSIQEFGYADAIVINKDLTVIGGHQRLNVLKDLGYSEIEVAQVDLTKKQEKALNIALNKITGRWDDKKLTDLFKDLNSDSFKLNLTGFNDEELSSILNSHDSRNSQDDTSDNRENERMNTVRQYNLQIYDPYDVDGFYNMPVISNDGFIPNQMIGFSYAMTATDFDTGIHFFVDDYQFERLWNSPEQYIDLLRKFQCVLSPNFSLYMDMPMAMKVWNIYRSRLLGHYWQLSGIKVIPTISWAEPDTFRFCFDGIPEGSIVAISTIGVKRQEDSMRIWKDGTDEMIKRIKPTTILEYGGDVGYEYPDGIEIRRYKNQVTERMKESVSK